MQGTNLSNLTSSFRRERRKTAFLGLLLVVLVVVGGRKMFTGGDPSGALAGVGTAADAENGAQGNGDSGALAGLGRSATLVAEWRRQPAPRLRRNLFAPELPAEKPAPMVELPEEGNLAESSADAGIFWRQLDRTLLWQAEQEEFRRRTIAAVRKDAESIQVTSIVTGSDPRALVGDRLVRLGDMIELPGQAPLRVWSIERRSIGVERDGVRVLVGLGRGQVELVGSP